MSAQIEVTFRGAVRILQAAMVTQIILGLTRYFTPLGWNLPHSVWHIHPCSASRSPSP